jgi:membrane-associated phospholipid phosphatase
VLIAKQKSLTLPSFDWREWLLPSSKLERRLWPIALGLLYILANFMLGGLTHDQILVGSLGFLDAYNHKSRSFLKYFFPFILTGVVYDSMRYYYWQGIAGHIHVAEPYYLERNWFGVMDAGKRVTGNEYFAAHTSVAADLICGFAYLFFVSEYLLTGFLLFFTKRFSLLRVFGWCFFTVNVMGFITYFIYPAAPPWYVSQYGLGPARMDVHAYAAAAQRFDLILGTHFFDQIYGRGVDVYGAYPSLHVSYPFLVSWVALTLKKFRVPAIAFYFLMCFSAVYLQHHYLVDVILGTTYACIALYAVRRFLGNPELT